MKLKLKREGNGWASGIYMGKGGISSLVFARHTNSFWKAIAIFSLSNFINYFRIVRWVKNKNK